MCVCAPICDVSLTEAEEGKQGETKRGLSPRPLRGWGDGSNHCALLHSVPDCRLPTQSQWSPVPLTPGDPAALVGKKGGLSHQTRARRRDLAGKTDRTGGSTPNKQALVPVSSRRSWPGASRKPPSLCPPFITMQFLTPAPLPAPPGPELCPAQKAVSSWATGDQGLFLCFYSQRWCATPFLLCMICEICLQVTVPLPASAPSGQRHLTRASPELPSSLRGAMAVCYCCCAFIF